MASWWKKEGLGPASYFLIGISALIPFRAWTWLVGRQERQLACEEPPPTVTRVFF